MISERSWILVLVTLGVFKFANGFSNPEAGVMALATESALTLAREQRRLADNKEVKMSCDGAFLGCMGNKKCAACFSQINEYNIDWASVAGDLPCAEVASFLKDEDICTDLSGDQSATTAFCQTFRSCAFWSRSEDDDGYDDDDFNNDDSVSVECDKLKECSWDGMHESFIGDGICHENLPGECYNTAICNWDGGDCCEDTCKTRDDAYIQCGHDGYACRDPGSENCDSEYTMDCKSPKKDKGDDDKDGDVPSCPEGQLMYRLVMYDSFGDGWDGTRIKVTRKGSSDVVYEGTLEDGERATEYICLARESTCYEADATGGQWGKEVSWDIRGFTEGSQAIAGGGAPMNCEFSTGTGEACPTSCFGRPDSDPTDDPDYRDYKNTYKCIEKQCIIQVGACEKDKECKDCLKETVAEHCHQSATFNAVIDCTMCQCTDRKGSDFCMSKANPGIIIPGKDTKKNSNSDECTPGEVLKGGKAVMDFASCTDFDSIGIMVTDFDQNNFGDLDLFESCAHAYEDKADNGGKTALECLQILTDAKEGKMRDETDGTVDEDTVSALAKLLYDDGEGFCDCAKRASEACPLCPSFRHFKTLLYESLDACMALDEIDCPAWADFYDGCKKKIKDSFGDIDFTNNSEQCSYVANGCDGVGPFPAFRRLDCYKEIDSAAWDFHNNYMRNCKGTPVAPTPTAPTPVAPSPTAPTPVAPTPVAPSPVAPAPAGPSPYVPSDDEYVPADDDGYDGGGSNEPKKKKHRFRNFVIFCLLVGAGYYCYRRRQEGFSFSSYRMMNRNFGQDQGMYEGFAMESSTSFEPAHLPPPPSVMGGSYDMGGSNMGGSNYSAGGGYYGQY